MRIPAACYEARARFSGGFVAVVVLSLGTDQVLHMRKVYPPWGQPMYDTGLLLLATTDRSLYNVVGGYVTARFAPHAPMRLIATADDPLTNISTLKQVLFVMKDGRVVRGKD